MSSNKAIINVLYVDDEKSNLTAFKANFRHDFNVFICDSAHEGLALLAQQDIQIVVTDQRMPQMTGIQFLEEIMAKYPIPVRILLTGYTDITTAIEAINKGKIFQYVTKPYDQEAFMKILLAAHDEYERLMMPIRHNAQYEFLLRQKLLR